jgi:uncharacterized protein (TIGR02448 family)
MKRRGLFFGGLLLAVAQSAQAEIGWPERLGVTSLMVATYPVVTGTSVLLSTTAVYAELNNDDQRVLLNARDGALQAVANGNLNDARLQAALELLRRLYAVDNVGDLQLAQWIATY